MKNKKVGRKPKREEQRWAPHTFTKACAYLKKKNRVVSGCWEKHQIKLSYPSIKPLASGFDVRDLKKRGTEETEKKKVPLDRREKILAAK